MSIFPRPRYTFCRVHGSQIGPCPYCLLGVEPAATVFQKFWRCAHHTSAIQNFFEKRHECEWGCHEQELEWYHNGTHQTPKSWKLKDDSLSSRLNCT